MLWIEEQNELDGINLNNCSRMEAEMFPPSPVISIIRNKSGSENVLTDWNCSTIELRRQNSLVDMMLAAKSNSIQLLGNG